MWRKCGPWLPRRNLLWSSLRPGNAAGTAPLKAARQHPRLGCPVFAALGEAFWSTTFDLLSFGRVGDACPLFGTGRREDGVLAAGNRNDLIPRTTRAQPMKPFSLRRWLRKLTNGKRPWRRGGPRRRQLTF